MNATSTITVEHLHTIFATHGLPEMLVSNNGSVFTSAEFSDFVKHNDIWDVKSASYYAASNGLAERAAQTFKVFMKKSTAGTTHTRASHFLSQYRITPHSTAGVTPAEILFGHWPRTRLDLLRPDISNRVQSRQQSQKSHHNQRARERRFQTGDTVSIQTILGYLEWLKSKLTTKLQDGCKVHQHSDHILAHSETGTTLVADDDWMNLPGLSQDSATAQSQSQGNRQMIHLVLLCDIPQDHPFHQNGMNMVMELKN